MALSARITPRLWFDAEEAANHYVAIFPNSSLGRIARYGRSGFERHGKKAGSVLTVAFTFDGEEFVALNGGPHFRFNEAVSFVVRCETQVEIDHYWSRLGEGGDEAAKICGWLKDRFGVSWQVVPAELDNWLTGDPVRADRCNAAIMGMQKLDIAALQRAYDGWTVEPGRR